MLQLSFLCTVFIYLFHYCKFRQQVMAKRIIRNQLAQLIFNRELRQIKRKPQTLSLESVRSIGILYDATENENYEVVKNYVRELRELKKEVLALGFVDQKELPNMRFSKLGLDFFTRKNLNWYFKPSHPMVTKFINADFDILIFLNIEQLLPLKYIAAATQAKFKIGKYDAKNAAFCDFMIKTNEQVTLPKFIDLVNNYLKVLSHVQP